MPHPELRLGRLPWLAISLMLATIAAPSGTATAAERRDQPNVVVIVADDLGYADVGFQGCKDIATPHLDALAKAGVVCTNGYVTCPVCAPTRAGLLAGRYQQRLGFEDNSWSAKTGLSTDATTIADVLKSAGYSTFAIGKWHLGQLPQFRPLVRGFTDHYGFLGGGRSFLPLKESQGVAFVPKDPDQVDLWRNEHRVDDLPYLTDAFGDEAVSYIAHHKADPFFIYLAFNAPHVPLQATDKYLQRFPDLKGARRTYAAMVSAMDDAIGRVSEALRTQGLEEKTLIFFLSDNGGHPIANAARNDPLRGEKGTVYEGGIRVPFVVKWSGRLPAGKTYAQPVVSLDIMSTALAAAGAKPPKGAPVDGVDLVPHL
jgi:arylsulfatase A-like enzyme